MWKRRRRTINQCEITQWLSAQPAWDISPACAEGKQRRATMLGYANQLEAAWSTLLAKHRDLAVVREAARFERLRASLR